LVFGKIEKCRGRVRCHLPGFLVASYRGCRESFESPPKLSPALRREGEGPEYTRLISTCFRLQVSFFSQEARHVCYSVHYVSSLGGTVKPHVVTYDQESDLRPTMDYLQFCSFVFDSCWFPRVLAFQSGCVDRE